MRMKWTGERLAVAVERYNALIAGLNKAAPLVAAILDGAKVTGAMVGTRERDKIAAVLRDCIPAETWARCYLDTGHTTAVYLKADINAPVSDHSCAYAEALVCVAGKEYGDSVWRKVDSVPARIRSVEVIRDLITVAQLAEDEARAAAEKAVETRQGLYMFID